MNRQAAFEKAVIGVLKQDTIAVSAGGTCMYRNNEGHKCAVGQLIPEKPENEEAFKVVGGVDNLLLQQPSLVQQLGIENEDDREFLRNLQDAHDGSRYVYGTGRTQMESFRSAVKIFAAKYSLNMHFIKQYDRQIALEKAVKGVIAQGKPGMHIDDDGNQFCKYKSSDGSKCAIGQLIPDNAPDAVWVFQGSAVLLLNNNEGLLNEHHLDVREDRDFISQLQSCHDAAALQDDFMNAFIARIKQLYNIFKLSPAFIEPPVPTIAERLEAEGLRLVHINHTSHAKADEIFRSATVVYSREENFINMSIVWLHPKEKYDRLVGADYAITRYVSGEQIRLPVPKNMHPVDLIKNLFGFYPRQWEKTA